MGSVPGAWPEEAEEHNVQRVSRVAFLGQPRPHLLTALTSPSPPPQPSRSNAQHICLIRLLRIPPRFRGLPSQLQSGSIPVSTARRRIINRQVQLSSLSLHITPPIQAGIRVRSHQLQSSSTPASTVRRLIINIQAPLSLEIPRGPGHGVTRHDYRASTP